MYMYSNWLTQFRVMPRFSRRSGVASRDEVLQRVEDLVYEIERVFRDGVFDGGDVHLYINRIEAALTNIGRIYGPDLDSVIEGLDSLKSALVQVNHVESRNESYIPPRLYSGEIWFV